jgi:hypothetical protein
VTQGTDGWKILDTYTVRDHKSTSLYCSGSYVRKMMGDAGSSSGENYHMAGECMYTENLCSVFL